VLNRIARPLRSSEHELPTVGNPRKGADFAGRYKKSKARRPLAHKGLSKRESVDYHSMNREFLESNRF